MLYQTNDTKSGYTLRHYYDGFGRERERHSEFEETLYKEHWAFNNNGQIHATTDASRHSITHNYNANNHLVSIYDNQTRQTIWQALETDALGNITSERLGSNITRDKTYAQTTGLLTNLHTSGNGTLQSLDYQWDDLGNLTYRRDNNVNKTESFDYDNLNRVTQSRISGGQTTDIDYNNLGNIIYKTGVGIYHYQSSRSHAVTQVTGERANSYQYDASGNMVKDNERVLTYNTYDKPTYIGKDGYYMKFAYNPMGKRYLRQEFGGEKGKWVPIFVGDITTFIPLVQETRYVGNVEFVRYAGMSEWVQKRYIAGKVLITTANNTTKVRYLLDDHLGSTHVIANDAGATEQTMSFDVFGARRDANTWAREHANPQKFSSKITLRGYTGHEQMDEVGLVHMGGRIYDPVLGRFLQADPMVQAPENIQSLNRYSYVMNNPLNATDPSGYFWVTIAVWALKAIAASAVTSAAVATAIGYALTAYKFYGYYQLARGVLAASKGNSASIGNFIGGMAKGMAQSMAITSALDGAAGYDVNKAYNASLKQGSGDSDLAGNGVRAPNSPDSKNRFDNDNKAALKSEMAAIDAKVATAGPNKDGIFESRDTAAKYLDSNSHPIAVKYKVELYNAVAPVNNGAGFAIGKTATSFNSEFVLMEDMKISAQNMLGNIFYVADIKTQGAEWHSHNVSTDNGMRFSFADGQPKNSFSPIKYVSYTNGKAGTVFGLKKLTLSDMKWDGVNTKYSVSEIVKHTKCISGSCL